MNFSAYVIKHTVLIFLMFSLMAATGHRCYWNISAWKMRARFTQSRRLYRTMAMTMWVYTVTKWCWPMQRTVSITIQSYRYMVDTMKRGVFNVVQIILDVWDLFIKF